MTEHLFQDELNGDLSSDRLATSHLSNLTLEVKIGSGSIDKGFISKPLERHSSLTGIENEKQFILKALRFFLSCCQAEKDKVNSLLVCVILKPNEFEAKDIISRWYEIFRDNGQWKVVKTKKC